jgi:acyl-CoA thioester hydrolase
VKRRDSITETTEIRVRFGETDALGIVWHGNFIKYFEEGREDFGLKHKISYLDAKSRGYSTPIVETNLKHLLPLKYGDVATVETTYVDTPANKLVFTYRIFDGPGKLVCTGKTVQVFLDENGELVLNPPEFIVNWKRKAGLR